MNISECIIVALLYFFDFVMDGITLGQWGKVRGDQRIVIKIKK